MKSQIVTSSGISTRVITHAYSYSYGTEQVLVQLPAVVHIVLIMYTIRSEATRTRLEHHEPIPCDVKTHVASLHGTSKGSGWAKPRHDAARKAKP